MTVERSGPSLRHAWSSLHRDRARELRTYATDTERRLWNYLKTLRQREGLHFRRQVPFGPYVADFACHSLRVIIEADGAQHDPEIDAKRDAWFARAGYRTIRVANTDVRHEWENVIFALEAELNIKPPPP